MREQGLYSKWKVLLAGICLIAISLAHSNADALEKSVSVQLGNIVTPSDYNDTHFALITVGFIKPYTLFRSEPAHDKLKTVLEFSVGAANGSEDGTIVSGAVLARRFFNNAPGKSIRPYIEGGIGIIYTGFKIPGQGVKVNFNPVIGVGLDYTNESRQRYFAALRMNHISNGNLHRENRGINSVIISFGSYF